MKNAPTAKQLDLLFFIRVGFNTFLHFFVFALRIYL